MRRILVVAETELVALVRTKAFILGILLVPVLLTVFIAFMNYAEEHVDVTDRAVAVLDRTSVLYEPLARAAATHNEEAGAGDAKTAPHYLLESVVLDGRSADEVRVALSARVKSRELFAFVELPADLLQAAPEGGEAPAIRFHSQTTTGWPFTGWLAETVNDEIAQRRFEQAGIDRALVRRLTERVEISSFGLVERDASGGTVPAREVDDLTRMGIPMFVLVLMFMCVMTGAMHLLNAIIEEKMSKISEVLLGSVTPFQLLAGKLLGVVAVSLMLTAVYLGGGLYALLSFGRPDLIDPVLIGWFLVFLVCAALMFGAVFLAIGSACSDLKDSQSMVQAAMMLIILAYLASFVVLRAPESALSVGLSFFPTITPFAMMLRLVMPPGPPLWQVLASIVLLMATTAGIVWAAGRIFRVGLLMQGKPPNLPELLRWVWK